MSANSKDSLGEVTHVFTKAPIAHRAQKLVMVIKKQTPRGVSYSIGLSPSVSFSPQEIAQAQRSREITQISSVKLGELTAKQQALYLLPNGDIVVGKTPTPSHDQPAAVVGKIHLHRQEIPIL